MTRHVRPPRRGFALPTTVIALAIVSLFIAASAFLATQEARAARHAVSERAALEAAEYGAGAVLRDWDRSLNTAVAVGATLGPWGHAPGPDARVTTRVTRATLTTFWVVSEGEAGASGPRWTARRLVNALLRLDIPSPDVPAALTARDSVSVSGSGIITGLDSAPPAVTDPVCADTSMAARQVAGVAAPDTSRICDGACGAPGPGIAGAPRLQEDPAAGDSLRYGLGAPGVWAALAARATVVLPPNAVVTPMPVAGGGLCLPSAPGNWGDPGAAGPCTGLFPVIHALGDVTLQGGTGQGVLLAEGDVRLAAGASFAGLVVAGDDFVTLAGGGQVQGAVFAGDRRRAPGDHSRVGDGGAVRYSACAMSRALVGVAALRRVRERWWAELF
jgi:hypothetical protein